MLGKLLQGRYHVVQTLGAGGFSNTYLALDTCQPGYPTCVVKHLQPIGNHPNSLPTLRRLFTREVQALQKLGNYDRVPQLIDRFEEDREFYLVQEFIAGHSLSLELQPGYCGRERHVVELLVEILGILEVVHSHGLIHRDLKPSNLIRRQKDYRLVLIDFGSVKQAWTQLVTNQEKPCASPGIPLTMSIGTPGYMPCEQGRGRPRRNSDIYALGMIGIQALTGLHPAQLIEDADSGEFIWQHQAKVSPELAFVLTKMVRYHFRDRYQTPTEALQALQPLINHHLFTSWGLSARWSAQKKVAVRTQKPAALSKQDTVLFFWGNSPEQLYGNQISVTSVANPSKKSAMWIGLGIGCASTLLLVVSTCYILRSPDAAPKSQNYSVSSPSKNNAIENISLIK